jgi:hypothetical protein
MCRYCYSTLSFFMVTIGFASAMPMVLAQPSRPVRAQATEDRPKLPPGQPFLGPAGIDAQVLHQAPYNLLGRKIAIGQVEPGRPGLFGYDKNVAPGELGLPLAGIFFRDRLVEPNTFVDAHAHSVASFMVGQGKAIRGVAPGARLYSGAMGSRQFRGGQPEECLTIAHVARQNGEDVRAINLSFGESLRLDDRDRPILDGNAHLTQCIDWLAQEYNSLFTVAGNQGKGGIPIPTDHYNGVTVAYTRADESGVYNKVDFANLGDEFVELAYRFIGTERNLDRRSSVSLVAPGRNVEALLLNGDSRTLSGTSFAAPQVTAAVAVLQEYGDRRLASLIPAQNAQASHSPADRPKPSGVKPNSPQAPNWSIASRRHEVMKAVLLNACDKLQDSILTPGKLQINQLQANQLQANQLPGNPAAPQGLRLGMTKTILGQSNQDWLASPANYSDLLPLDPLFGAGQLNLYRAYVQFSAGQFGPDSPTIPARGWDYNQVGAGSTDFVPYRDYALSDPLQGGSYLAVTLTWDRRLELVDRDGDGHYSLGDRFRDRGLNNLNLYLLPANETDSQKSVWSSRSSVDSVEHIFRNIPTTGRYKLRVQYEGQANFPSQKYAIAWWGMPAVRP